jgi:hypothetical protein
MTRWLRWGSLAWVIATTLAHADGPRRFVVTPKEAFTPLAGAQPVIYLNRCVGNCTVIGGGANDARSMMSSIPPAGNYTLHEFTNYAGQVGSAGTCVGGSKDMMSCTADAQCMGDTCNLTAGTCTANASIACTMDVECNGVCETADADWAAVVQCMKEVYSPYAVTVTDVLPPAGAYTEAVIAGQPGELAEAADVLGIAPFASDCSSENNVLAFTFANHHPGTLQARALGICWTAAQETAHTFGLDHEFQFVTAFSTNMFSACMDPMTYRTDCGGEKFFRNADAQCGEYTARTCRCGGTQNSHGKLISVLGEGTSIVPPPDASFVTAPSPRQGQAWPVFVQAGSKRGVDHVELWLNGYPWATQPGGVYGMNGQIDPSNYTLTAPANVPDGTIDIVIKAYDDLGVEGDSSMMTVEKGPPCTSADTCAKGQSCSNGRCAWDTPTGTIGEGCPYPQFCTSGVCTPGQNPICTQYCAIGSANACPHGYDCVPETGGAMGYCEPSSGGCCSASEERGALWRHGALAALVLVVTTRRRRARPVRDKSC